MLMIINADDLGLSITVNKAIFDLLAGGHITSTSLLANAPATEDAVVELRRQKNRSFGVHLNVTGFHPLTRNAELSPILDSSGCFAGNSIRSTPITWQLREAIFQEWSAQIDRLFSMGLTPSHIDSHHHVHTIPGLFFVLNVCNDALEYARFASRRIFIPPRIRRPTRCYCVRGSGILLCVSITPPSPPAASQTWLISSMLRSTKRSAAARSKSWYILAGPDMARRPSSL